MSAGVKIDLYVDAPVKVKLGVTSDPYTVPANRAQHSRATKTQLLNLKVLLAGAPCPKWRQGALDGSGRWILFDSHRRREKPAHVVRFIVTDGCKIAPPMPISIFDKAAISGLRFRTISA